ncbi:MAG: diaminopimelate epimerase [Clostridia bacterium]|nr:diaminopimelate epimerase [Clostridia bacterium]
MMFYKMQGLGNDYVYLDCTKEKEPKKPEQLARMISNRNFGVGSDGLILICESSIADLKMRMFNSDGSEAQMCGNGIRCVAKLVYELGLIKSHTVQIETIAGIKELRLNLAGGKVRTVTVDMGEPILTPEEIPIEINKKENSVVQIQIKQKEFNATCVSMGNPHAVIFVDNVEKFEVEKYGSILETHPIFPQKANIEFAQIIDRKTIKMRVWERGAGETLACGTGACATLVAAVLNEKTDQKVRIELLGGNLEIEWKEDNHIYMTGPAVTVFKGEWIND